MTRILFIGAPLSENFGGPSIVNSIVKTLRKYIPNAEFTLISTTRDYRLSKEYEVKIVPNISSNSRVLLLGMIFKKFGLDVSPLLNRAVVLLGLILKKLGRDVSSVSNIKISKLWNAYESTDIIIDIWGIVFSDTFTHTFKEAMLEGLHLFIGKLLNKPVIKYTADVGPLENRWNRFFAKFYLNRIDLILARGEITKKLLIGLGITTPIQVCPDTAFLFNDCSKIKINKVLNKEKRNKLIIGISISHKAEKEEVHKDQYCRVMVQTVRYLINNLNAFVVLIPNETASNTYNDIDVAKKILERVSEKEKVVLFTEEYSAWVLKGLISNCDLLIAARYHSIIAGISMCIPTLAISWHHKYFQVLKLVGQEEYVCDIKKLSFNLLQAKITKLYKNRKKIESQIADKLDFIKRSILEGGKITKDVLANYNKDS